MEIMCFNLPKELAKLDDDISGAMLDGYHFFQVHDLSHRSQVVICSKKKLTRRVAWQLYCSTF